MAGWTATSNLQVLSRRASSPPRDWVAANTPPDAVFVTDGWVNSLTDAAGRKRLTTFGPYIANLGYQPDERISNVATIYCGGDAALSAELMRATARRTSSTRAGRSHAASRSTSPRPRSSRWSTTTARASGRWSIP